MKEDFLHYVWRFQYFRKENLRTTGGEEVLVLHPGVHNRSDAGPDFSGARLRLGETEWVGSVELHLNASDWRRHQHQLDAKYNQVILHVVWEEDEEVFRQEGTPMPTLELKGRVALPLQALYQEMLWSEKTIPCAPQAPGVDAVYKSAMMDWALLERLEAKAEVVSERMDRSRQDWESTVYQTLAVGFGFKINQEGFLQLAQALPWPIVSRYRHNAEQLEALIFGQAGFLNELKTTTEPYLQKLAKEHQYLVHKHNLPSPLPKSAWNMLRLRPANFPAVRLGQFCGVLHRHAHLWSSLQACTFLPDYFEFFRQPPPLYWQQHYAPGKKAVQPFTSIGQESVLSLLINVVAPLFMAFSRRTGNVMYQDKAIALLESLPKENNKIMRLYAGLNFMHTSAADSQALLGLYQQYCEPRKCVHCTVGHWLMKQNLNPPHAAV